MPAWAAWIVGIALATLLGMVIGQGLATESTRASVANECRQAGAFTVKRTGFQCAPIKRAQSAEADNG
ncbi:hypothetical protein KLEP174_gp31 [Pseudomonas phage vB_PcuM_ KLEP17-4]|nr:hypothetical protein KLEP174_gp31 [Pseudomonas phage vB_PcuM_ KLEP17-4]